MRKQQGWSPLSLESIAAKVSKIWKKRYRYSKNSPNQLERAYLFYADIANIHIHASMFSVLTRFKAGSDGGFRFSLSQESEEEHVIASAHALALIATETHNLYFALGLDERTAALREAYFATWLSDDSP